MHNPSSEPPPERALRIPHPAKGWKWAARLLPAVLACAFAGAGEAQTVYRGGLDDAVGELTRMLVNEARLHDKRVLVKSDDFFEMGTELRLDLSEMLRGMSSSELTRSRVPVAMSGSDEDVVRILHGRWRREPDGYLYLELSVAAPVESGDPTALRTVKGLVPIDERIGRAIAATPDDWGRLLVLRLERGVHDRNRRSVHLQPMTIEGDGAQGGRLEQFLTNWLGNALVKSRLFTLVEPPPGVTVETDGKLYVAAAVGAEQVEVSLRVLDNEYQRVTFAKVGLDLGLFPAGVFPDLDDEGDPGGVGGTDPDALHRAAKDGDIEGLERELAAGADVDARDGKGWTALLYAVAGSYPTVVERLMKAGADPDVRAPNGATALFMAAAGGHTEFIERLMKAGADVSIRGPKGRRTAAEVARAIYGDAETARRNGEPLAVLALLAGKTLAEGEEEEARRRAEADDEAFARAESAGTAAAYAEYRSLYPQGRHWKEAGRRERERTVGRRFRDCAGCPELVVVPSGTYKMGSPAGEGGRDGDEGPVHEVTFARPFAVGVYEVTFGEWDVCVSDGGCGGYRPGDRGWGRGRRPVINVSWENVKAYVKWLSRETGKEYRLLSESEWEYVARAGTKGKYHFGSVLSPSRANYGGNEGGTVPVGSYSSNDWGLYDVDGNVWEWVEDCWNGSYRGAPGDGSAWESGDCGSRVLRGGSWFNEPGGLRAANRSRYNTGSRSNYAGFRVARTLD